MHAILMAKASNVKFPAHLRRCCLRADLIAAATTPIRDNRVSHPASAEIERMALAVDDEMFELRRSGQVWEHDVSLRVRNRLGRPNPREY